MNIHVVMIAYALDILPLVESVNGPEVTFHIYLHSKYLTPVAACGQIDRKLPNARVHDYGVNRGLARSWNEGIIESYDEGADAVIVANDDVQMSRDDLHQIADCAASNRECGMVTCMGWDGNMQRRQDLQHVIFAINPIAISTIGYYDENYWPIYGEDVDYSRRCGLAGVKFANAGETGIRHLGSSTVKSVPDLNAQNQVTFPANEQYHIRKWGGGYGKEVWAVPFNDARFDLKIRAEDRHSPYPGYERTDIDLVRV